LPAFKKNNPTIPKINSGTSLPTVKILLKNVASRTPLILIAVSNPTTPMITTGRQTVEVAPGQKKAR
jgi:hypothetical protein